MESTKRWLGRIGQDMNRTTSNVVTDLLIAGLFTAMMATGYVLRFPLPAGTNRYQMLWGLTRHEWGSIHYTLSLSLLVVIAIHLALHWKWVVTVIGKRLRLVTGAEPSMLRSGLISAAVFAIAFGSFAVAAHRGVKPMEVPLHELDPPATPSHFELSQPFADSAEDTEPIDYWTQARRVFRDRCLSCHGPQRQQGDIRVDRAADFFRKSDDPPLVVPGNSSASPLIEIVSGARPNMRQPERHQLPAAEVLLLRAWIEAGADRPSEADQAPRP